ncbi:manganese efflux pump MntP family protein [Caldalkalibacillus salinus]|uniref:manganese efflux pump MntP n=1 Tax=Caldalkalibacillus salinus TaxID=2803787 RepID=UPI001F3BF524|nr:manganese efflux pump [Caldalkalibacillus salinus]
MPDIFLGELLTLLFVSLALAMDSFSVSIGLGMRGIRLRHLLKISIINGLFHFFMPLLGALIGQYLSGYMGSLAVTIGGIILIFIGLHMILGSIFDDVEEPSINTTLPGIALFAFGVSLDAFSVGLPFGLFSASLWLMVTLFGITASILTALGLLIGRKVGGWIGQYSEIFGGFVLLVFGVKFLV